MTECGLGRALAATTNKSLSDVRHLGSEISDPRFLNPQYAVPSIGRKSLTHAQIRGIMKMAFCCEKSLRLFGPRPSL
jgi:hypothetical protein